MLSLILFIGASNKGVFYMIAAIIAVAIGLLMFGLLVFSGDKDREDFERNRDA